MPRATITAVPPTDTPVPTPTPPLSESWSIPADRIFTVPDLKRNEVVWTDGLPLMLVGCYVHISRGKTWRIFSYDGQFGEGHYMAGILGFGETPTYGACYEMVVEYWLTESYCYSISSIPPFPRGPCYGWEQATPEFYIIDTVAVEKLSLHELRVKYPR